MLRMLYGPDHPRSSGSGGCDADMSKVHLTDGNLTPIGPVVMLSDSFPDIVHAHQQAYGHTPWSDRTVAPWQCRPCKEAGVRNVF